MDQIFSLFLLLMQGGMQKKEKVEYLREGGMEGIWGGILLARALSFPCSVLICQAKCWHLRKSFTFVVYS